MKIALADLRQKLTSTLEETLDHDEASCVADYLVWAEMSGVKTQGIVKMTGKSRLQNIKPQHELKIDRDTKLSRLINAGAHAAPYVSQRATDVAIQKAKEHGFGIVGVHNSFSSSGAQAYYAEKIAQEDLIGIVMARVPPVAAAFGGIDAIFGTNPIGFSFPTNDGPLVFDMATSAMTFYGLLIANAKGERLPDNTAIDKEGNSTTDPAAALEGALLSFDRSYKGSGIAMVVETLTGPLTGAAYGGPGEWGSLFMAIDPNLLIDTNEFKTNASDLISKIKAVRKKPGVNEIRLPGERAQMAYKEALASGIVDVDEAILKELGYV